MINYISQSGQIQYNIVELVIDTEADRQALSTDFAPGSTVFVVENSFVYMLNGNKEWKKI